MGSNTVVKTVGKQLKYYFDVKRLEDGFDLRSKKVTEFDHASRRAPIEWNPYLLRPTLHHEGLHDRALKHYFKQPEVRALLTRLEPADTEEEELSPHERQIRKSLMKTMKKYQFGKSHIPEWYYIYTLGGPRQQPYTPDIRVTSAQNKKTKALKGGWPVIRNVSEPDVPPDEAERLISNASKILLNSATADRGQQRSKSAIQRYPLRPVEKPRAEGATRPVTAVHAWDTNGHRVPSAKYKTQDDNQVDQVSRRLYLRRPQSSPKLSQRKGGKTSGESASISQGSASSKSASGRTKGTSARQREGSVVSIPTEQSGDEEAEEVTEGDLAEYVVTVKTGNCIGASTTAAVHLTLYGEKGRTPALHLDSSQYNKVKFQRGKEDLFVLKTSHVGQMTKVKIGHDRPELNYAWYLDSLCVRDVKESRVYRIPCRRWLSGQDEDRNTHCCFRLNRHKDADRSETSTVSEDKTIPRRDSNSESTPRPFSVKHTVLGKRQQQQTGRAPRTTGSATSKSARPRTTQSKGREIRGQTAVAAEVAGKSKNFKPSVGSEDERGKDRKPKPVEEHEENPAGKKRKAKPAANEQGEYLAGYKAGLEAIEASEQQKREEERVKNRQLLSGPSIHDACHRGDLERVDVLLHTFPEMKDSTDENGWSPLHIAASGGQVEMIKRLTAGSGGTDLDVETPTGYTPTHLAAKNGHSAAVKILNAMGASMDCTTVDKQTPLHLASSAGHLECVKYLVANGSDLLAEDTFSRTPLDLAQQYGQHAVDDFLQRCHDDLANPSSTFALMLQSRSKRDSQTAEETAKTSDKDSGALKNVTDERPKTSTQRRKEKEKEDLEVKREQYEEQHRHMEKEGVSFLDLIRQEMDSDG